MLQRETIDDLIAELDLPPCFAMRLRQDGRLQYYVKAARTNPGWIARMISRECGDSGLPSDNILQLAVRFASAIGKWAASGFAIVADEEFDRRWAACQSCAHLVDPPTATYRVIGALVKSDLRVCRICGCNAISKAKLQTERCPVQSDANPDVNRWGQPLAR